MRIDSHTAYNMAIDLLKRAGFELAFVARQTESCYYEHSSRRSRYMRVSMHRSKKSPIGLNGVAARLTFTLADEKITMTEKTVTNRVKWAIGEYFMHEFKTSQYRGKRGTWETTADVIDAR